MPPRNYFCGNGSSANFRPMHSRWQFARKFHALSRIEMFGQRWLDVRQRIAEAARVLRSIAAGY